MVASNSANSLAVIFTGIVRSAGSGVLLEASSVQSPPDIRRFVHAGWGLASSDIGWLEEGEYSITERQVKSAQIIYSLLEQDPAKRFIELAGENEVGLLSRVPHASNTLTGEFDHGLPVFDPDDHRAHRKNEWLEEAMRKVDHIRFLVQEDTRTMAQSAIQFVLKQPAIISVLPNLTNLSELKEYTSAVETPEITDEEQAKLDELWAHGFDISEPEPQFREI